MSMTPTPNRIGRPPVYDITIGIDGVVYLSDAAYNRYFVVKRNSQILRLRGAKMFYDPGTNEIGIRPAIGDKGISAITPLTRGYKIKLKYFLKHNLIELKEPIRAKFEKRGKMLVFEIPKDAIA